MGRGALSRIVFSSNRAKGSTPKSCARDTKALAAAEIRIGAVVMLFVCVEALLRGEGDGVRFA
jgi:hypothetical protein